MLQDSSFPLIFLLLLLLFRLVLVEGGGRQLLSPRGRGDFWGEVEPNCGGVEKQWGKWLGQCGVCGDEWGIPQPRPHELGGRWGSWGVVNTFHPGQTIEVEMNLTESVGGSIQLHLCPEPGNETEECFSQHPLTIVNSTNSVYYPLIGARLIRLQYQIPQDMTCSHCVLQWRYTTNHMEEQNGFYTEEEFRVCADIAIQDDIIEDVAEKEIMFSTSPVAMLEVEASVTEDPEVTTVNTLDEIESNTFIVESESSTLSSSAVSSLAGVVTTIAPSDVIENRTQSIELIVTTIESAEIISDENNGEYNEVPVTTEINIIDQTVGKAENVEDITVQPGVIEIRISGNSSFEEEVQVYTTATEQPLEYSLIRISNTTLEDETDQEGDKPDYEITRSKQTVKSDSLIISTPVSVTSVKPLSTSIPSPQTTDPISVPTTVTPTSVLVAAATTTQTTTSAATTQTIMMSSASTNIFISSATTTIKLSTTEIVSTTTTTRTTTTRSLVFFPHLKRSTTPTVTTPLSTTTRKTTKLFVTSPTNKSTTPNITTSQSTTSTTASTSTTGNPTEFIILIPKQSTEGKFAPNSINSISVETVEKSPKVPEHQNGIQSNHTVIYQVFSRGPSLGYGLFLSVPAAIIFFVGVGLVYLKKSSEISDPKKHQPTNQTGDTLYHSVPKDDSEVGEEDITQLTNMTSSTALITNEYTMCPEYASIPDVVPSSVRNSQRYRLDDSLEESSNPRNSMPNLNKVINIPIEEAEYKEPPAVQYSSLNELNSSENSPKSGPHGKKWQSDDLEAEKKVKDTHVEGWTGHQRWKSEDWEKDQSFIAMLARRLEHVDSRAEVTEL